MVSTEGPGQASPERSLRQRSPEHRTEAIRAPLATILGHAQYLKRSFLNGRPVSPDEYLSVLSTIERSVWAIEGQLRVLENTRDQGQRGDD